MRENTTLYGNVMESVPGKIVPLGNRQRLRIDPREDTPDSKTALNKLRSSLTLKDAALPMAA